MHKCLQTLYLTGCMCPHGLHIGNVKHNALPRKLYRFVVCCNIYRLPGLKLVDYNEMIQQAYQVLIPHVHSHVVLPSLILNHSLFL